MSRSSCDEAIAWHDRLSTDLSAETLREFEAWCAADPDNVREFDQQLKLFGAIEALGWRPDKMPAVHRRSGAKWIPLGLAAGALAAAAAAALLIWPADGQPLGGEGAAIAAAKTSFVRPVRLQDGTIAILAAGAQVAPDFGRTMRRVLLSGDGARLIVAHDAERPFVVVAKGVTVRSRGGVVDVEPAPAGARVTALEGPVQVMRSSSGDMPPVLVAAGQSLAPGAPSPVMAAPDERERVTMIDADGLPLADLLEIANRGEGPGLALADARLAARRVIGRFDVRDHRALARRLAAALGLSVAEQDGRLVLSTR
jgi:transmembrane sensor